MHDKRILFCLVGLLCAGLAVAGGFDSYPYAKGFGKQLSRPPTGSIDESNYNGQHVTPLNPQDEIYVPPAPSRRLQNVPKSYAGVPPGQYQNQPKQWQPMPPGQYQNQPLQRQAIPPGQYQNQPKKYSLLKKAPPSNAAPQQPVKKYSLLGKPQTRQASGQ